MNKFIASIIIVLLTVGCNDPKKGRAKFPGKVVATANPKNRIVKIDYRPTKIRIDLSDVVKGDFDDFFSLKNIIYLDDKNPIGEVSVIRQLGDKLFILDRKHTQQLFCFDLKGKLIWEFNSKGNGPLEYGRISDFVINEKNRTIDILDSRRYKIINLDIDTGIAKTEFKLGCYGGEMVLYGDQDYLLYTSNFTVNEELNYKLLLVNTDQKVNSGNLYVHDYEKDKHWEGYRSLEKYDNTIYFTETLNDTIYTIKNDTLRTEYYIDFMDKKYPNDLKFDYSSLKNRELRKKKPYISPISRVREKNGVLNFMFSYKLEFFSVFYDIDKRSTLIFNSLDNGIQLGLKHQIILNGYIDEGFIGIVQPYTLVVKNLGRDPEGQIIEPPNLEKGKHKIKKHLEHLEIYDIMSKTDENSNPVLLVYEFKKNN